MNGWVAKNVKKNGLAAIAASQTNAAISEPFPIYAGGAVQGLVIKITASAAAGTVTAKLQTGIDGVFVDSKPVTITASGDYYIKLLSAAAADQTYFPLLPAGQVVITTAAASSATITGVVVVQEL